MKRVIFFLILPLLLTGCKRQEEEVIDLDTMVMVEEEWGFDHLAKEEASPEKL